MRAGRGCLAAKPSAQQPPIAARAGRSRNQATPPLACAGAFRGRCCQERPRGRTVAGHCLFQGTTLSIKPIFDCDCERPCFICILCIC